jgi:hypothetical protein
MHKNKFILFVVLGLLFIGVYPLCAFESLLKREIGTVSASYVIPLTPFKSEGSAISVHNFIKVPYSFDLFFDVPLASAYAGVSVDPASLSPDGATHLAFSIKGSVNNIPLKVEIQTESGSLGRRSASLYIRDYLDQGILHNEFQTVQIPLVAFANLDDISTLKGIVFVFEHDYATSSGYPTTGTVNIADLSFITAPVQSIRVDHFADTWGWMAMGGNMGSMSGSNDANAHTITFDNSVFHVFPASLRSTYKVPNLAEPNNNWCGMFMLLGGGADGWTAQECDLSSFDRLSFWVRAASDAGNPKRFKIELLFGTEGKAGFYVDTITSSWQKMIIPLSSLVGLDRSCIKQINIIYEREVIQSMDGSTAGVLFFDELQFEKAN